MFFLDGTEGLEFSLYFLRKSPNYDKLGCGITRVEYFDHAEIRKYGISDLCNMHALDPGELI